MSLNECAEIDVDEPDENIDNNELKKKIKIL